MRQRLGGCQLLALQGLTDVVAMASPWQPFAELCQHEPHLMHVTVLSIELGFSHMLCAV